MTSPAPSHAIGLELAVGAWKQAPSGDLSYNTIGTTDNLNLEDDLKYVDETRFNGRVKIDMPAVIPNIYLMMTPMEFEGEGSKSGSFQFGDETVDGAIGFFSDLKLNHNDIALYYGIPVLETVTLDKLNIDIGINVRIYDLELTLTQQSTGVVVSKSSSIPVPMAYLAIQFRPLEALGIEVEGRGISISDNTIYSLIGRVRYKVFGPLFVTGGYRSDTMDISEEGAIVNTEFSGPFIEAGLSF
jgi:outer membrane protein